ncbi:hypothetical protein [Kitasatospora sp. NPDC088548]|uniref:hypothetical protein n=1 Tax=Kitasatospora sp. NPDC088548 TaxID=3364075 RepID=UPI0037F18724
MQFEPTAEFSALAAAMPALLAVTARPFTGDYDDQGPRVDVTIDRDDDECRTYARVYVDGTLVESREAVHVHSDRTVDPVVRFHLLDSGDYDDTQPHDWYVDALRDVADAPDDVRAYAAERAREYHRPADCQDCRALPCGTRPTPGRTLLPSQDLNDLTISQLEDAHAAAADLIRTRLDALVRSELRAAVTHIADSGMPMTKAVIPAYGDTYGGKPGEYDLTEIALSGSTGRWIEVDLSDVPALVRAVEAIADWRPAADGDPLEFNL